MVYQVLKAASMHMSVVWGVAPCSTVEVLTASTIPDGMTKLLKLNLQSSVILRETFYANGYF